MIKSDCQQIIKDTFFEVYECEEDKICKIKDGSFDCEIETFKCKNDKSLEVLFIAIDNCIFTSSDEFERCDFLLMMENEINFIELKVNVKPKKRKDQRIKALNQLKSCIKNLQSLIKNRKIYCYICFGHNFKIPNISSQTKSINFQEETGSILKIDCFKEFKNE